MGYYILISFSHRHVFWNDKDMMWTNIPKEATVYDNFNDAMRSFDNLLELHPRCNATIRTTTKSTS
jgi:hypothetical protein